MRAIALMLSAMRFAVGAAQGERFGVCRHNVGISPQVISRSALR